MIILSFDRKDVAEEFSKQIWQVQNRHLKQAVTAGAVVIEGEYREVLKNYPLRHILGSASFQHAFMTVARKVRMFRDGNGVWAVIGNQAGADGRSFSPQAWFAEHGTVERFTKAGQKRGMMPALHWLERAADRAMPLAVEAFWTKLRELLDGDRT